MPSSVEAVREPLPVGTSLHDGEWAVAGFAGDTQRMMRYKALGKGGRKAELREYLPKGWIREGDTARPEDGSPEALGLMRYLKESHDLAKDVPAHSHIVPVLQVWEERGTFFTVQEWIAGFSLKDLIHGKGPLTVPQAVLVIEQVGSALHQLHDVGLLHRDVSPGNVLLAQDRALLMDFESLSPYPETRYFGEQIFCNPVYAPLEMLSRFPSYGAETDVYGLAATLYYSIAGRPAPPSSKRVAMPRLPALPNVPTHVFEAMERAMTVRAKDRTPTVESFLAQLHGSA